MLRNETSHIVRLLRWSEKYTKTDMVYLASGGMWSIVGQFVAAVVALSVSVAFAHWVPKEVFGNYKFILSVVGILSIFSLSNLGTAVAQSAARGYDGALIEGFKNNLRWSVLVFAGAVALGAYYAFNGNMSLALGILLGGCATPFLSGANLAGSFLNGKQDFPRATIYFGIIGVIVPAATLIATIFLTSNVLILVSVFFLSNLLVDTLLYMRTAKLFHVRGAKFDPLMLSYGKHLSAMGVIGGIAGGIDQLLLFHYAGAVNLAIYAFAIGIVDQAKGPVKVLDKMMQARFSNRRTSHIEQSIENKMLWMLGAGIGFIAMFYVLAPWIYGLLFPTYPEAVAFARVYALGWIAVGTIPIGSYFVAHKKIREQYMLGVGGSIIQIAFMTVGVVGWGLWGLVLARVLANVATTFFMLILYYYPPKGAVPYDPQLAA
jgi:O-antigen/teichoic acid export membrane protein